MCHALPVGKEIKMSDGKVLGSLVKSLHSQA